MNILVMAVHDRAADAFGRPFFTAALGLAIRDFQTQINDTNKDNPLGQHPDDFDLYQLGLYDDNTGKLTSLDEPKQIAIGKQLKINGSQQ